MGVAGGYGVARRRRRHPIDSSSLLVCAAQAPCARPYPIPGQAPKARRMVSDLKRELASLKIDRERPAARRRRWPAAVALAVLAAGAALYALRAHRAGAGVEVETVRVSIGSTPEASSGTAILTASGYIVPRRKAVVSAKIQGRLAELRVEEGSRVTEGQVIARLESADYSAQVDKARAAVQRAEADLDEYRRQLR